MAEAKDSSTKDTKSSDTTTASTTADSTATTGDARTADLSAIVVEKPSITEAMNAMADEMENKTPVGVLGNPVLQGRHGAFEVAGHASQEELQELHRREIEYQLNREDAGQ